MMKKVQSARILMMVGVWFMVWPGGGLLAKDLSGLTKEKKYHPKMESVLGMLAEKYSQDGIVARRFAYQRKIPFEDDQVTVILVPPPGKEASAIDEQNLTLYGAVVEAVSQHLIRAKIPISRLVEIADEVDGISYIRLPHTPLPASVISEGVALTNAVNYHSAGYEGQNTRVAVIDLGFNELEIVQNVGELPSNVITKDFTGTSLTTGSNHGTKVAQIVYDMAPQSQIYLIKIADEVDLENAKDYCITEGVDIISHSWGWPNTNFTDGTGLVCDIANDAQSHGILWVNAAGNAANQHYQHFFTDTDNDDWHEFSWRGNESQTFQGDPWHEITIFLTWDAWPTTDQDYDLYLYDPDSNLVASSTNVQTGTQPPTEKIVYTPSYSGTYSIRIRKSSATGNEELKLFTFNGGLWWFTPAHSLWPPADAVGVMSAGAINQADWETGPQESYSSQGPTNDGRVKPDISGPDGVLRYADGGAGRGYGTSYAAPHVAGAAALLLSKYPNLTPTEMQLILENWAVDMGEQGKDSIYGSGRLNLSFNVPPVLSWTGETNYTSDGLDPETGISSTNFTYRVKYSDEDNDPPASSFPRVHILKGGSEISGSPFTMNEVDSGDATYSDGKLYTYTKAELIPGTDYDYRFEAEDTHGIQATGDPINVVDGPDISEEIPILEVDPASLAFGEVKVPQTKTMTFRAYNTGTGALSGTISDDRDWITVDPTSLTGNDNIISITVDTGVMGEEQWKEYTGTVTVTSNGGTKTVSVSVTPTCVKVYPNPFNPWRSQLTFWGSGVPHATIKVYTVSGELVKTLQEINGEDRIYWDGKNEEGKLVARGIYLFVAINPKEKSVGRFMVVASP